MSSTANMMRCRPSVLGGGFCGLAPIAAGRWYFISSSLPWPSGVRISAMSLRMPSSPTARSAQSPSICASPSRSMPSSVKKAMAASRSSTTMPTLSMRWIVMSWAGLWSGPGPQGVMLQRQRPHALTGRGKYGIHQRWRQWRNARFAHCAPGLAGIGPARHDVGVDARRFVDAQQRVVVEIALLGPPGLEGDLARQRRAQCLDDAAFHLRHDGVRMHGEDRIDDANHAVHLDAAVLVDRKVHHLCAHRVVEFDDRDALMNAGRGLAPAGAPRGLVQHGQCAWRLRQQRTAELVRVLLAGVRDFIEERLAEEAVLRVVDGAPEADRDGG